jgi:hypothetical protein
MEGPVQFVVGASPVNSHRECFVAGTRAAWEAAPRPSSPGPRSEPRLVAQALAVIVTIALLATVFVLVRRLQPRSARTVWLTLFTLVIAGGIAMMITHSFITRWGIRSDARRDGIWSMMEGTADRPFVFRRLAPELARAATDFADQHLPAHSVDSYLQNSTLLKVYPPEPPMTRRQQLAIHAAYALVWLAWLGSAVAGAWLLCSARGSSWYTGILTSSLALCLIPVTFSNGGYVYDSFEVLLWTLLLGCLCRGWLLAALGVFALALLNKESLLALVPALYPMIARHVGTKRALMWTALFALLAAAWLAYIRHTYAASPGMAQEWSLWSNLEFWSKPSSYLKFAAMYSPALLAPRGGNVLILVLLAIPLRFGFGHVRADLRYAAVIASLALIPLFVLSGCIDETRALGPLFPFILVIGAEGLARLFAEPPAGTA